MKDADRIGIAFKFFAGNGRHQRFVPLPRRRRAHDRGDRPGRFDLYQDGFNKGRNLQLRVEQIFKNIVPAAGLKACRDTDTGQLAVSAKRVAAFNQVAPVRCFDNAFKHRVEITGVINRSRRNLPRKFILTDKVARTHFDPVEAEILGHTFQSGLNRKVSRRLTETTHRYLSGFIRGDRNRLVFN